MFSSMMEERFFSPLSSDVEVSPLQSGNASLTGVYFETKISLGCVCFVSSAQEILKKYVLIIAKGILTFLNLK